MLLTEIFPPEHGGSGRWFWEIYRRIPRELVVVAAGQHPDAARFDLTHDLRVHRVVPKASNWELLGLAGFRDYHTAWRGMRQLAKAKSVQQIHCGRVLPEGVLAWAHQQLTGIPYLCFVHGEDLTGANDSREHAFLIRRVLKGAQRLIANSHNTSSILTDDWNVPADKVSVLHPGVDTRRFTPHAFPEDLKDDLGWSGRKVLLTVGRLQRRKGHDKLIEAVATIRQQVPEVLYVIAGNGEEEARCRELIEKHNLQDHVQLAGAVSDDELVSYYQACDLFVLPNRTEGNDIEGFGMVLVEAQACGRPVIAGDSGGTRETMLLDETGIIVDCTEAQNLVAPLVDLLTDDHRRTRMGTAAVKHVRATLDWNQLYQQTIDLFRQNPGKQRIAWPVDEINSAHSKPVTYC